MYGVGVWVKILFEWINANEYIKEFLVIEDAWIKFNIHKQQAKFVCD